MGGAEGDLSTPTKGDRLLPRVTDDARENRPSGQQTALRTTTAKDGQAPLRAVETRFAVLPVCKALRFFSALFGSPGTEVRRQTGFMQS